MAGLTLPATRVYRCPAALDGLAGQPCGRGSRVSVVERVVVSYRQDQVALAKADQADGKERDCDCCQADDRRGAEG